MSNGSWTPFLFRSIQRKRQHLGRWIILRRIWRKRRRLPRRECYAPQSYRPPIYIPEGNLILKSDLLISRPLGRGIEISVVQWIGQREPTVGHRVERPPLGWHRGQGVDLVPQRITTHPSARLLRHNLGPIVENKTDDGSCRHK